jgi:DNA-binding response OmpR family regulator
MNTQRRILLVEDDTDLREALARQFKMYEDFKVDEAGTGMDGLKFAEEGRPDVVILDVELPDMDGRDVCRLMRKHKVAAPILMLTAQSTDSDAILGLDAGANDYVPKPIRFPVLLARVRAHLRTHEQSDDSSYRIGPYEFRPAHKFLVDQQQRRVRLTEKETEILTYLYRAGGRNVGRDELILEVWGADATATAHTLETHMYRLRQKLEPNPAVARYLMTETGGYSLQP